MCIPKKFFQERSGDYIGIACDNNNLSFLQLETADRAISHIFSYSKYDVINNNCHKYI